MPLDVSALSFIHPHPSIHPSIPLLQVPLQSEMRGCLLVLVVADTLGGFFIQKVVKGLGSLL